MLNLSALNPDVTNFQGHSFKTSVSHPLCQTVIYVVDYCLCLFVVFKLFLVLSSNSAFKPYTNVNNYLYICMIRVACPGGAGSTLLIHPLDSLKVKMQTFPHLYDSGVQCAREVTRQDGLRGLYRGLTPGVTLSMTEASIRYMTYGVCQVTSLLASYRHNSLPTTSVI